MNGFRVRFCSNFLVRSARWLCLIALLVLPQNMGFAQATTGQENTVDPLVAQLRERVQKGEWDALIQQCDQVLATTPGMPSALLYRGMALNGKRDFDGAIKSFDQLLEQPARDPVSVANRADAFSLRSESYFQQGNYLKAIDSGFYAVLEKGDHAEAFNQRGKAFIARRQYDRAIQNLDRAISLNPKFAEAISNRGYAYRAKGNVDQFLDDQKKALEIDPQLAVAYQRRAGTVMLNKGDANAALNDLNRAIELKPDFVEALCDRAYFYMLHGDNGRAIADLNAAIRLNPASVTAHVQRGRVFVSMKSVDKALQSFNEAIRLKADCADAYYYRGLAYQAKRDAESALTDFTKAIELEPKLDLAYRARADIYKKQGKSSAEKADLAKLKELSPPPSTKSGKKTEEPLQRFVYASKPVSPGKRQEVIRSAAEIDRLVDLNYTRTSARPNAKTTDAQFVRRIYLDVTGTIPTYQQTQKFLAAKEPDKRAKLIDELLNSDGYASHSFNYWADVLRYVDSLSSDVRGEPYRQWIKQSLAENKPWDKFVREMLTADGLIWQQPMTGYLQRDAGMPLDNMNNTVRIFLGTRIGCAQCHNHPSDRWTQKDFYHMAAFTFGTATNTGGFDKRYWDADPKDRLHEEFKLMDQDEEERRLNSSKFDRVIAVNMRIVNDKADQKIRLPKDYAYDDGKPDDIIEPKTLFGSKAELKPGETPRTAFARWVTTKDNPRFALTIANRLWKRAFGAGLIEPVDDMTDGTVAENPELMSFLDSEIKRLDFDMKEFQRTLFNTAVYQRQVSTDDVPPGTTYHFPGPMLRRMSAEQAWDSFVTLAVVDPDEYRELPAHVRSSAMGVDLSSVSAGKLLEADSKATAIDEAKTKRQEKYTYKGVLLARASELPSPVPPNHFLRTFGQSDRELISASSTTGSVPQVLFMFNGPITHMLLEPKSTIHNNVMRKKTVADGIKVVFLTILNREPDEDEAEMAKQEINKNGPAGYGNIIWSLVNTREFLFIQ